jgi:hypothetical protein
MGNRGWQPPDKEAQVLSAHHELSLFQGTILSGAQLHKGSQERIIKIHHHELRARLILLQQNNIRVGALKEY